jgi:hypothetical protein
MSFSSAPWALHVSPISYSMSWSLFILPFKKPGSLTWPVSALRMWCTSQESPQRPVCITDTMACPALQPLRMDESLSTRLTKGLWRYNVQHLQCCWYFVPRVIGRAYRHVGRCARSAFHRFMRVLLTLFNDFLSRLQHDLKECEKKASWHISDYKCVHNCDGKAWSDHTVHLGVHGRIILKWSVLLGKHGCMMSIGFIWLRIETGGGLFWTRYWTSGFHNSDEFFDCLNVLLLTSLECLCFTELANVWS